MLQQHFKFRQLLYFQNVDKNEYTGDNIIGLCNFLTKIFGGREKGQKEGEILQKVLQTF